MSIPVTRFLDKENAIEHAKILSKREENEGEAIYVVESPDGDKPRFCVDDNGFIRAWESLIAVYVNGKRDKDY